MRGKRSHQDQLESDPGVLWAFYPVIKTNPPNPKKIAYPGSTKTRLQETNAKADFAPRSFAALGFVEHQNVGCKHPKLVLSSALGASFLQQVSHWPHRPVLPRKVLWWGELPKLKAGFPCHKCQSPRGSRRRRERGSMARHGPSMGLPEGIWFCSEKLEERKSALKWQRSVLKVWMTYFTWMHF